MTKKMTAGQFAQFGHHIIEGLGWTPTTEEAQVFLGHSVVVDELKATGRRISSRLQAIKSGNPALALVMSDLLAGVGTVALPAIEAFQAADHFKEKGKAPGDINLWLGDNFKSWFLKGSGKIEVDTPAAELRIHRLRQPSVDAPIIKELGGEVIVETHLAQMWEMLKQQPNGEPGNLLVNGYWNIFYICNQEDVLCAVYCRWRSGDRGWGVGAFPVTFPGRWLGGRRVVSR